MGIDDQDKEIGRLVREKREKERELTCLKSKRDRFVQGIRDNHGKLIYPLQDVKMVNDKTLIFDDGEFEIEWLDADDMVGIATEIRKLSRDVEDLSRRLKQIGID